jgi:hypothetical protein
MTVRASFDIGYRTFTSCLFIEHGQDTGEIVHWCKKDFVNGPWPARKRNLKRDKDAAELVREHVARADHTANFLREFFDYLGFLFQDWARVLGGRDVDRLLIEKQLRKNPKALFIQRNLRAFVAISNKGQVPGVSFVVKSVVLVPANIKYSLFAKEDLAKITRGRAGYKARKQAAIHAARLFLCTGGFADYFADFDDPDCSDTLIQLLADLKKRRDAKAKRVANRGPRVPRVKKASVQT